MQTRSLPTLPDTPAEARTGNAQAAQRVGVDASDIAACRASLRHGSRSFLAASLLLPREVRDAACALYAFCRMADDAVDEGADEAAAVAMLRARLACIYDPAEPASALALPADRALAGVVAAYGIPRALPEALVDGFAWDAEGRGYETLDALLDYAARVAGTVGAMMSLLMGVRAPDALARACELGVAMQLSNIARDVGEDAAMGRLYLPRQWMREAGIDPDAWLARPVFTAALGSVVQRVLEAADLLYARVGSGVAQLPLTCRPGINAARFLYADIGAQVRRAGCDSVSRRAVVPASRKGALLLRALVAVRPRRADAGWPVLSANAFLVDAVAATMPPASRHPCTPAAGRRSPAESVVWVIELFDRMERRERGEATRPAASA
ncbi:phytoene/squalene synthase family protein [Variovorax sp. KK3]|uniref:phytoene/squalene synthase family protein n=1 Tax=Variovorax sp. KK3 TaxID=1855728 RepID=UPI0009FB1A97|nr:phytoene/squalene synthase family protein [Variovorax sp. KK3]